ncbi:folate-binding protein [Xanthobacteraceae bacterium Astr-EGSB]|uniref:CAF17-like 4Fe-4S cluster assembly/insertion protein YgfZ n=1 Tax=Astrobacterium formosum TaxID=3069710 RepID=UPI0027B6691A|nr:folate-binding protein [Xanthobacteraceae bacterium Astr-EGSB]
MKAALLPDRGVVRIAGEPARGFLNGLVTGDMASVTMDHAAYAALLTPQGKMVVDFLVVEAPPTLGGGLLLDCPRDLAAALVQKLNFYKLRAQVTVEDLSDTLGIVAIWDQGTAAGSPGFADPRLPALGRRVIREPHLAAATAAGIGAILVDSHDYEAHRIALGIPRGGVDFAYGDAFPHEADMDQLAGIDFAKGCYVGQEVVSRMQHRATARTRVVPLAYEGFAPQPGTPVTAGDKAVGTLGSSAAGRALALVRLDRVADALAAGLPLAAGNVTVTPVKPDWATFAWPGEASV